MTDVELQRKIDILYAEREIRRAMDSYTRGIDQMDLDLARSAYHPDSIDHHGAYEGPGPEFPPYVFKLMRDNGFGLGSHQVSNFVAEFESETSARVNSSFVAVMTKWDATDGHVDAVWVAGRYRDHFTKRDGAWKISERTMLVDVDTMFPHRPLYPPDVHTHRYSGEPRP
jgi:hypothetical protein